MTGAHSVKVCYRQCPWDFAETSRASSGPPHNAVGAGHADLWLLRAEMPLARIGHISDRT
jgi:hypothetical protein